MPNYWDLDKSACLSCPVGQLYDVSTMKCESCLIGFTLNATTYRCVPVVCGTNQIFSSDSNKCINCPAGSVVFNNHCLQCPSGSYYDKVNKMCVTNYTNTVTSTNNTRPNITTFINKTNVTSTTSNG